MRTRSTQFVTISETHQICPQVHEMRIQSLCSVALRVEHEIIIPEKVVTFTGIMFKGSGTVIYYFRDIIEQILF